MFRKLWKQTKIVLIIIIIIIALPRSILPRSTQSKEDSDYYIKLNESERRLPDYKDDNVALALKLEQLDLINKRRKKFNAKPLKLDIFASRVANKISREAAENNFAGHWNLRGEKPYHRYAFAGGYDHVSENAYAEWSSANLENSASSVSAMMKAGHQSFMAEKAPRDGHKQTVIAKDHNYVGIGFYVSGSQFRYYEEYIDRYFEFTDIPSSLAVNEKSTIKLKTDGTKFLYFMIIYYEDFPKPLKAQEIARRGSYQDYTDKQYLTLTAWELARHRNGPYYEIPVSFDKRGLYYIHLFIDDKEITKPVSVSTKGKTPYTGIVISVN
ncbi:MAG TPA: CAP domain-containing protein [Bacteroidales bacterium]|nr:CAP domain-containing protein [Bacteroidales bacterium]